MKKRTEKKDIAARKREKGSAEIWILFFVLVVLILLGVVWIGRNLTSHAHVNYPVGVGTAATNESGMVRPDPQSVKTAQEVEMEESELKKGLNRANANVSYLPWPGPQDEGLTETAGPGSDGREPPDPSVRP
ncbi:MAG: hypothetical protein J5944_00965 [Lentisphaeria bacterium]|nr:hypothetical protein [Lentisphaeria bacterium]